MTATAQTIDLAEFSIGQPGVFTDAEREALLPRPSQSVSEWAATYRYVARGPKRGPWSNRVAPHAVGPMDSLGQPGVTAVCGPTQATKTEILINAALYWLFHEAEDVLYVLPDQKLAEDHYRDRIGPAIHDSVKLRSYLLPDKAAGSRGVHRYGNGSLLAMVGGNSIGQLSSRSFGRIIIDESDKLPTTLREESSAIELAIRRSDAYPRTRRIGIGCTPTTPAGAIWEWLQRGDRQHFYVTCPRCDKPIVLAYDWTGDRLKFDTDKGAPGARDSAHYLCPECDGRIEERERPDLLAGGRWHPTRPDDKPADPMIRSYWFNALYSPFRGFPEAAAEIMAAKDNDTLRRNIQQNSMALPFEDEAVEAMTQSFVAGHALDYDRGMVPEGVQIVTGGVDIQKAAVIYVFRGWSILPDEPPTSFLIEAGYIDRYDSPLDAALDQVKMIADDGWALPDGELIQPRLTMVDSGYDTEAVYRWVRKQGQQRWRAVKGAAQGQPWRHAQQAEHRIKLCHVNVTLFKQKVHTALRVPPDSPGYFGLHRDIDRWYCRHLVAEVWEPERVEKGRLLKGRWKALRKGNHALDAETYAMAAATIVGVFGEQKIQAKTRHTRLVPPKHGVWQGILREARESMRETRREYLGR